MKTAADFRRAELRRKLRRAEDQMDRWESAVLWPANERAEATAWRRFAYWSDIARILRRTLREDGTRRKRVI